jgi:hypothetical protein
MPAICRRLPCFLSLLFCACTIEPTKEEQFEACAIGQLTGNWRFHYTQTQGNCGAIADQTGTNPGAAPGDGCNVESSAISKDKCSVTQRFTCNLKDNLGTQAWVLTLRQVATDRIQGSGSLQINYPTGVCRSAYAIEISQQ